MTLDTSELLLDVFCLAGIVTGFGLGVWGDEAEVDVMDELGGGDKVGEVALDVNVGCSCLPQLQHLVFKLVMQSS